MKSLKYNELLQAYRPGRKGQWQFGGMAYRLFEKIKPGSLIKFTWVSMYPGPHKSYRSDVSFLIGIPFRYTVDYVKLRLVACSFNPSLDSRSRVTSEVPYRSLVVGIEIEQLSIEDMPRYLNAFYKTKLFDKILMEGKV